jgi:hypothetical protein
MVVSDKKNRGEWSELYALTQILSSGKIQSSVTDKNITSSQFEVLSASRRINGVDHTFKVDNQNIQVIDVDNRTTRGTISRHDLSQESQLLLDLIKKGKGRSFAIPEATRIMLALEIDKVTDSKDKTDLILTIYDPRVKHETKQGFSIKSFMGGKPTLLNASGATSIEYEIIGHLSEAETVRLNSLGPISLVTSLYKNGFQLVPSKMDERFADNLKMIDSEMDVLLEHIVLASFLSEGRSMRQIVDKLVISNPLKYSPSNSEIRYSHKVKDLLEAVALGMRPTTQWGGEAEAKGGHLIVTSAGELLCHHALDKDTLRNYLFENTKIDTPSRDRYFFGKIVGNKIKLNFQIRFK